MNRRLISLSCERRPEGGSSGLANSFMVTKAPSVFLSQPPSTLFLSPGLRHGPRWLLKPQLSHLHCRLMRREARLLALRGFWNGPLSMGVKGFLHCERTDFPPSFPKPSVPVGSVSWRMRPLPPARVSEEARIPLPPNPSPVRRPSQGWGNNFPLQEDAFSRSVL